ncbi:MAG: aldehyde dehydrogenase family protein [Actinomycetota bacterium]|nr:aldehyde dehydrogenase family protein [Actinomycetota bacterium]
MATGVDRFYIGGEWVEPKSGDVSEILNPATEEVIATAAVSSPKDAVAAIEAARVAFDEGPWPGMAPAERGAIVRRMGEILHTRRRELGDLLREEVGATLYLIKTVQVSWAIEAFALSAEWAETFPWEEEAPSRTKPVTVRSLLVREPVGVVSAITPFNYPLFVNSWKVAPAIAMGNTVVLKPAPWTPLDAFEIARAAEEAGLPPGVLNVIGGGGVDVGEEMVGNPMVDMVSFTGSLTAGRSVGARAAQTVKKVQLELGGKSAAIVLDDASAEDVAMRIMGNCMLHAGQGCGCTTRLLVPETMHDEVVERTAAMCALMPIGDPADPSVVLGPLIREQHRARVESYVQAGIDEGATLVTGGRRPPQLDKGFFYEPTVFTDVRNDMRIAQEEIFGPVLAVIRYRDEDEAVRIANDSVFGLGGAVYSPNRPRALAFSRRLRTGFVGIGGGMLNFHGSWGGYKQSGVGREWRAGLEEYTELKHLTWVEP